MTADPLHRDNTGPPRWLVIGFAIKLVLITVFVGGLVWWTS